MKTKWRSQGHLAQFYDKTRASNEVIGVIVRKIKPFLAKVKARWISPMKVLISQVVIFNVAIFPEDLAKFRNFLLN
jgi:hypothetical protein